MNYHPIETAPRGEDIIIFFENFPPVIAMDCRDEGNEQQKFLDWTSLFPPYKPIGWLPIIQNKIEQ
jgi:hypothetical protein